MTFLDAIAAALLYPGLLTALGAGILYRLVRRPRPDGLFGLNAIGTHEGLAAAASWLLAGLGLATLPWPLHPAAASTGWLLTWVAFELAFLLPLMPALTSGTPLLARAAMREAQLGVLARALIWSALASALVLHGYWGGIALAAHLPALLGALAAFPPAVGWGPFGPEEQITPDGTGAGLAAANRALDEFTRDLRAGALLAAILVAGLPVGALPAAAGLALLLAGIVLVAALLRNFDERIPRMTLPNALRFCLAWPAPLALAATLSLVMVR